jgi:Cdc6-like AAA superfamily ATPase
LTNGSFGIENESIIIKSGILGVFLPHIPVDEISHFFDYEEATRLVSVINSPGQHILLYGNRGVGKTSLAKTPCKLILQKLQQGHFFEKRSDSGDTFYSIFEAPLKECGIDLSLEEATKTHNQGGGTAINAGFAKADLSSKREAKTTTFKPESPSWVAKIAELRTFDEQFKHYTKMRVTLELDDSVKANYGKFGNLLSDVIAIHGQAVK